MTSINKLSSLDQLSPGDLLAVWATNNGDTRKASVNLLTTYLQGALTLPGTLTTQYAAPSASPFSVTVAQGDTWLLLTPTGTLAVGTIVLPSAPADKAVVIINCTQEVTALTVSAGGTTVTGAPSSLGAGQAFSVRFDAATNAWYRDSNSIVNISTFAQTLLDDPDAATARATLGLGSISTQAASNVAITGGSITGITDLAVADGGTGASTDAQARINLGVEIGVDVQAWDADLDAVAGLAVDGLIVRTGAGTAAARTITAGTGISVADGDGVSGNPTIAATSILENVAAADLADIADAINTTGKAAGRMVWDTTNTKIKVATGSAAADTWVDADGTNAVTPA
jgi:hypothetical protein